MRRLIGIDSQVVEGLLAKGRSSSRELNFLLRGLAADMLVADIQLGILGLASKHSPVDFAIDEVLPLDPRLQWRCSATVGGTSHPP